MFDFDGTLFNTLDQLVFNMNEALNFFDFPELTVDEYRNSVGGNVNQLISKVLGDNSNEENISKVKKKYLDIVKKTDDNLTLPYSWMAELLKELEEKGIALAINSNRFTHSIEFYLNKFMDDISFVDIQGHNPPNPSKPDAYGVNMILKKTGFCRDEVLYVGDSFTDIRTAKNSGVDCVIVNWGYSDYDVIKKEESVRIISNPFELLDYIS